MRLSRSTMTLLLLGVILGLGSGLRAQVALAGNVFDGSGGPLLGGTVYHVTSSITVPAGQTLTIQPGAIVKFAVFGSELTVSGNLIAEAPSGPPIIFSEFSDDSAGGDTNNNGPSVGVPGYWRGVTLAPGSNGAWNNVQFRFAGQAGRAVMRVQAGAVNAVVGCQFSDYAASGIDFTTTGIGTVDSSSFTNGSRPIINCRAGVLAGLTNNSAGGHSVNNSVNVLGTTIAGSVVIDAASIMGGAHILSGSIVVPAAASLTLNAGVVLKFSVLGGAVTVQGEFVAAGAAGSEVVITSFDDDDHGGDTNNDGPSSGTPGQIRGVTFSGADPTCSLTHTIIRYSGQGGFAGIGTTGTDLVLSHVQSIDHSAPGVNLNTSPNAVLISNCNFDRTTIPIEAARWTHLPGFSNNGAANCTSLAAIRVTNGSIGSNTTVSRSNLIDDVVITNVATTIDPGVALTLNDGVIVKSAIFGSAVNVQGDLVCNGTAGSEVVFTTLDDDGHGGDTNLDGSASIPSPGKLRGLSFSAASVASVLTSTRIRYSGQSGFAGVTTLADITMTNCTVEDCLADGLELGNSGVSPTIVGCAFDRCAIAIDGVRLSGLVNFGNNSASNCSVRDSIRAIAETITTAVSISKGQLINDVIEVTGSLSVTTGSLTIDAGITVKSPTFGASHTVSGTLTCNGTASEPVVFTTIDDDDHAGDTNLDGASNGTPGTLRGLSFFTGSDASSLEHVIVRYSGQSGFAGVTISGADISLVDCTITDCLAAAINLSLSAARPLIRGCDLSNNSHSIRGARWESFESIRDNTATGNGIYDSPYIESGAVTADASLPSRGMINGCYVVSAAPNIAPGATLDIERGVVVKVSGILTFAQGNGTLNVLGSGAEPVVLTMLADDEHAGDTNKDGPSAGSPGQWRGIQINGGFCTIEHALVRYAGQGGFPAVSMNDVGGHLKSVRVEHSAADGINILNSGGPADNLVAWSCAADGIELSDSFNAHDLRFATVSSCGAGIRIGATHSGVVRNSISSGNTIGNFIGATPGNLFFSSGDPGLAGTNGNINVNPMFVDEPNGDLNLQPSSPCMDAAEFSVGVTVAADHIESSRVNDHDLDGVVGADMGAYEFCNWEMAVTGRPVLGETLTFTMNGVPALVVISVALLDFDYYFAPYGMVLAGSPTTLLLQDLWFVSYGYPITIPNDPFAVGYEIGVQMGCAVYGNTGVGNVANLYRGVIEDI